MTEHKAPQDMTERELFDAIPALALARATDAKGQRELALLAELHARRPDLCRCPGGKRTHWVRCAQCGHAGPAWLFEPFNTAGNLACKAVTLCELRQQGADPAALLGTLAREFAAHPEGLPGELDTLDTRALAELDLDLRGPRGELGSGLAGSVRMHLGSRGDSAQAIADTEADRLARKRRRAVLKAAETRRANRAGA